MSKRLLRLRKKWLKLTVIGFSAIAALALAGSYFTLEAANNYLNQQDYSKAERFYRISYLLSLGLNTRAGLRLSKSLTLLHPVVTPTPIVSPKPNQTPSPIPTPKNNPTPVLKAFPNYKFDTDYPILLSCDCFGGTYYNSYGNGVSGPYVLNKTYHVGDTIHIKAVAQDPKGRNIHYKIELNSRGLDGTVYSNEASLTFEGKDIGDSLVITVGITVDTPYHRYSDLDDYMQYSFVVKP